MRIKPEIQARLEQAFVDAGFTARIDFNLHQDAIYALGHSLPVHLNTEASVTATVRIPESWLELSP